METTHPDMICISSRENYHKHRRWIGKIFITIAGSVTVVCLLSSILNPFRRGSGIANVKIIYQNPLYFRHTRTTQTGEMQFSRVLQTVSVYKTKQLREHHTQTAGSYNYTSAYSIRHFDSFANKSEQVEGDNIQSITKKPMKRLPQAIIIGVKKCGTRALLEYLRLHPDIRAPGPEPHFFDRYYHLGLDWYRKKMPPTLEGQITMEKTPKYFVTQEAPIRISNMSKDIKLIVVVRDPVIRAISDYTQGSSKDPNLTQTFADKAFHRNRTGKIHKNWSAIKTGIYINHVKYWLNYFPKAQMHFVSGENLVTNPAEEVEKVTDFLHLKRVISSKHFYFNETKGFPCLKKQESGSEAKCFDSSKGRKHPYVDKRLIQRLKLFFKPYNEEFYDLVGKDFGWS